MSPEVNKKKVVVGIAAVMATMITIALWFLKTRMGRRISATAIVLSAADAASFWIWYANLPDFSDLLKSNRTIEELGDKTWETLTKGDLR